MISVISMREAYFAQSKRENKRHQHDGGGIWWCRENQERAMRVRQSTVVVVEQFAVLRKGWGRSSWETDVVNSDAPPDCDHFQQCQIPVIRIGRPACPGSQRCLWVPF